MVRRDINFAKYNKRPSPPYSASKCPGLIKTGNDGQKYESRSDDAWDSDDDTKKRKIWYDPRTWLNGGDVENLSYLLV